MTTHYLNFDALSNGNGTAGSPWNSFASAQSGIVRGDTVMVSGVLRGLMEFTPSKGGVSTAARTKWLGAADNPFTVTAGEPLTGWVQCTAGDTTEVGSGFANIWKTTITKSSLPGANPYAANICEAGAQIPICVGRAITTDKFFVTDPVGYHVATTTGLSGANVVSFRLPAATDPYTRAQILTTQVNFVATPNTAVVSAVADFDATTKVITLATPAGYESNAYKDSFALFNLLPSLKRGEWGFKDNGATATIYCYPQDVANWGRGQSGIGRKRRGWPIRSGGAITRPTVTLA